LRTRKLLANEGLNNNTEGKVTRWHKARLLKPEKRWGGNPLRPAEKEKEKRTEAIKRKKEAVPEFFIGEN